MPGTYAIPSGPRPCRFEKLELTQAELVCALESSRLRRLLQPPDDPPLPQPPLALGTGHIALLLAAGHLDGVVQPDDEPPHVVRGTARKVSYVSQVEELDNTDGSTTTKTTLNEKIVLTVRAVGADGTIRTFSQE